MRRRSATRTALAFAPGHITGLFSPRLAATNPLARGSVGAGIVLELGAFARASWTPGFRPHLDLRADQAGPMPISTAAARRVLAGRRGTLSIRLRHELPIGQGFGMSAAGALASSLAAASVLRRPWSGAVQAAHLAELEGGGGLGGVSAILGGGLEFRTRPGIPPFGRVNHRRFASALVLSVVGRPIASPAVLRSAAFLRRVDRASADGLRSLRRDPDARTFLAAAERFGDRLRLAPPSVRRILRQLRRPGVRASQAMFGRSIFAVAFDSAGREHILQVLESAGVSAIELHAATRGAWRRSPAGRKAF